MSPRRIPSILLLSLVAACGGAPVRTGPTPAELARRDGGRPPYTRADVEFMTGMIAHHGQALVMARMAEPNGGSSSIRTLAGRILVSQSDEIAMMTRWLADRKEAVPADGADHAAHAGHGGGGLMPGMLTPAQLDTLARARGTEFDRRFLVYMIQHHSGAVGMVEKLLGSHGAAQDDDIFKLASDVGVDQTTEINRMQTMLDAMSRRP